MSIDSLKYQKLATLNVLQLSQLRKKTRKLCAIALLDSTLTALATFVIIQRLTLSSHFCSSDSELLLITSFSGELHFVKSSQSIQGKKSVTSKVLRYNV